MNRPGNDLDPLRSYDIPGSASRVHILLERLRRILDAELLETLGTEGGLRLAEWRILYTLAIEGEMNQVNLLRRIVMNQAVASRSMATLMDSGLIEMRRSASDRRSCTWMVTPAGRARFEAVDAVMTRRRDTLDGCLDEGEIELLTDMLIRVARLATGAAPVGAPSDDT